jgi:hypothetical protein
VTGSSSDPVIGARFHAVRDVNGLYTGQITVRYRVAFLSTSDLAGDNAAGIPQVFVHDSGLPEVGRLVQVSHSTAGPAYPPVISGTGDRVAFLHDEEIVQGLVEPVVFAWDRVHGISSPSGQGTAVAEPALDSSGRWLAWTMDYTDFLFNPAGRMVQISDLRSGRVRGRFPTRGTHRAPSLGRGASPLVSMSTDPGDGGAEVPERPVELRRDGTAREIGLPAGNYGTIRAVGDGRLLLLTSTEDLDGTNAAGREVLFTVRYRP